MAKAMRMPKPCAMAPISTGAPRLTIWKISVVAATFWLAGRSPSRAAAYSISG